MTLDQIDRRLFMRGLMLTSAGLIVPKPVMAAVPRPMPEMRHMLAWADRNGFHVTECDSETDADQMYSQILAQPDVTMSLMTTLTTAIGESPIAQLVLCRGSLVS